MSGTQATIQFDRKEGQRRRDEGMKWAVDHADAVERGWSDMAYEFLVNVFLKHHHGAFMTEDYRKQAEGVVPPPPDNRAFGGIISRARNKGLIKKIGIRAVKNEKANCANAAVWIAIKPKPQI